MSLRDSGQVRMLKLGLTEHNYALVDEGKFSSYLRSFLQEDGALCRKVMEILGGCREVSITQQQLVGATALREDQLR